MLASQVDLPKPLGCVVKDRLAFLSWLDEVARILAGEIAGFSGELACDFHGGQLLVNVLTYPGEGFAVVLDDDTIRLLEDLEGQFKENQSPALSGGETGWADGTLDCISLD